MKTIYRVEHYDYRHGPYRAGLSGKTTKTRKCVELANKLSSECNFDHQPPPPYDGISDYHDSDYYCGFDSLDKLFDWFERWLEELDSAGYVVAVFEVPSESIKTGHKQVMFPRKVHKRRNTVPLKVAHSDVKETS
jgi:hypothetical protein